MELEIVATDCSTEKEVEQKAGVFKTLKLKTFKEKQAYLDHYIALLRREANLKFLKEMKSELLEQVEAEIYVLQYAHLLIYDSPAPSLEQLQAAVAQENAIKHVDPKDIEAAQSLVKRVNDLKEHTRTLEERLAFMQGGAKYL